MTQDELEKINNLADKVKKLREAVMTIRLRKESEGFYPKLYLGKRDMSSFGITSYLYDFDKEEDIEVFNYLEKYIINKYEIAKKELDDYKL